MHPSLVVQIIGNVRLGKGSENGIVRDCFENFLVEGEQKNEVGSQALDENTQRNPEKTCLVRGRLEEGRRGKAGQGGGSRRAGEYWKESV